MKDWSLKEIEYLKENSSVYTLEQFAKIFKRTVNSVRGQAYRQKLDILTDGLYNLYVQEYTYYIGDEVMCHGTIQEIADQMGKSWKTIANYRYPSIQKKVNRSLVKV